MDKENSNKYIYIHMKIPLSAHKTPTAEKENDIKNKMKRLF